MIESVTFTLVPAGITNSILAASLAILGKSVIPMMPPPREPKVSTKRVTKMPKAKSLKSITNFKVGA